LKEKRNWNYL